MEYKSILETFLSSFNNREIAIMILLSIFFIFALTNKPVKISLHNFLSQLVSKQISSILITLIGYTILMVFILSLFSLWDYSLLKDTIGWILFIAIGLIMKVAEMQSSKDTPNQFFKGVLLENVKFMILLEFIVNLYAFNVVLEIILISLISFIAVMNVIVEHDEKYSQLKKPFAFILSIYGLSVFLYSVVRAWNDPQFVTYGTLISFLLPILLTVLYIPYLYVITLVFMYEDIFVRIEFFHKNDLNLQRYAKIEMFKSCLLSTTRLNWIRSQGLLKLIKARDKDDIQEIVKLSKINNNLSSNNQIKD